MSESYTEGGAGPALAAHSKDGSVPGQTPASEAIGRPASSSASNMAPQARDAVSNAASAAYSSAAQARDMVSERGGRAADQVGQFVREQPVLALMMTGVLGLTLGLLLGRR
jgi:ElaB/YqjD/DUF883 family membrane-anchored ribosome-binding protein